MWRANIIPFSMKKEDPMPDRRAIKRADTAIPITIKLVGTPVLPPPIAVETANISPRGLSIVIKIKIKLEDGRLSIQGGEDSLQLVQYLLLDNRMLKLEINILPQGESIRAIGKVKWYERSVKEGAYYVKAGILIEEMEQEHKGEWLEFLDTIHQFLACLEPRKG